MSGFYGFRDRTGRYPSGEVLHSPLFLPQDQFPRFHRIRRWVTYGVVATACGLWVAAWFPVQESYYANNDEKYVISPLLLFGIWLGAGIVLLGPVWLGLRLWRQRAHGELRLQRHKLVFKLRRTPAFTVPINAGLTIVLHLRDIGKGHASVPPPGFLLRPPMGYPPSQQPAYYAARARIDVYKPEGRSRRHTAYEFQLTSPFHIRMLRALCVRWVTQGVAVEVNGW